MITVDNRIVLRKPNISDIEALYILKNDVESNASLGGFSAGYSKEDIADWIKFHNKAKNEILYVIEDMFAEMLIGHVGFYDIDYRVRKANYGILIAHEQSRGKGFGRICTGYMVSYGFSQLNLNRIECSIISDNQASLHLVQSIGFVKEGVKRQCLYRDGKFYDAVMMAILYEDYINEK